MNLPDDRDIAALRDRLAMEADAIRVPAGDVDEVVATGRRRRWTRLGAAALSVAVALGASVTLLQARDDLRPSVVGSVAPEATPTATTEPSLAPSPSPSLVAPPGPDQGPATATWPALLIATKDGIVRWQDGTTSAVPGIDTRVDLAFPDGQGGIVFQRNPVGIGRLVDGRVGTLVALSQFPARTFADYPDVEVTASSLQLRDVDPASGRIVLTVRYGPQSLPERPEHVPIVYDVVIEATVDGDGVTELATVFTWEEGFETISVGGSRTATNFSGQVGAGVVRMLGADDDEALLTYAGDAWGSGQGADADREYVHGGQLARDGSTIAVLDDTDGEVAVQVLRVEDGTTVRSLSLSDLSDTDALGLFPTVLDHIADAVLLGGRSDPGTTLLIDLTSGESTLVDVTGHAAFAD